MKGISDLLTEFLSHPPRTHRPDEHGLAVGHPPPRGTHQDDPVAGQAFAELLRRPLRAAEPGVYRQGEGRVLALNRDLFFRVDSGSI